MLIPTQNNIKTITDMRENALALLNKATRSEEPIFLFHRSTPKAVLLSIAEYSNMQEMIENYMEEQEAKALAKEPRGKLIPFAKIAKKYLK